jgi:bis(5'-nucleosidyl)-tetraphosphatase
MSRRVFQKSCGVVPVHVSDSGEPRFLLLNSGQVRNPKATWEFPKGGMEDGEEEETTALRECTEETGLSGLRLLQGYRALDAYVFHRSGSRIKKWVVYFVALVDDPTGMKPQPDGREHVFDSQGRWYQWLSYEEARKTLYHAGQKRVLATAWAHLQALGFERLYLSGLREERARSEEPAAAAKPRQAVGAVASGGLDR